MTDSLGLGFCLSNKVSSMTAAHPDAGAERRAPYQT
jgi:hypothetical protein